MAKTQPASPPVPPVGEAKPARLKLIVIMLAALLLAVGLSVAGTWFFLSRASTDAPAEVEAGDSGSPSSKPRAIYEVLTPAFVVNFNSAGRQRYMQVSVALMARDEAQLKALKVHMPVLRNRLVMLFSDQDFEALQTPVGKELMRQKATASVQELARQELGSTVVEQVLFTNLVLQ